MKTISNREIPSFASRGLAFRTNNRTVEGYPGGETGVVGRLPEEWIDELVLDRPLYIVFSYSTPIGWLSAVRGWVVPPVKYSRTTSVHQGLVRQAALLAGAEAVTDHTSKTTPWSTDTRTKDANAHARAIAQSLWGPRPVLHDAEAVTDRQVTA